jgi:pyruvate,orthophosphate dikinase
MDYMLGTMIETPRAALVADSIGKQAEFFSFGTNDLTQMTMGFSRDDAGKFLPEYLKQGMYEHDPFRSIDQKGVGLLVQMAVQKGRSVRPTSRWASAANTAATRPRWPSSTARGWTT